MTDKDKLDAIRAEIHRLVDVRGYGREMANDLFAFMDSLPNEPVSIWHDVSEEPNGDNSIVIAYDNGCTVEPSFKDFKSYSEWGTIKKSYRVKQWAYVNDVLNLTNKEEPVSEDFKKEVRKYAKIYYNDNDISKFALHFANWQKEHLWKPSDGDDLPEYEREVVVFTQNFPDDAGIMSVAIGHRPNPMGFNGKSLTTGEVEHYTPKTYDKGGWNIPDVRFWLDVKLPEEIEL